jgi:hypothetical protein
MMRAAESGSKTHQVATSSFGPLKLKRTRNRNATRKQPEVRAANEWV